MGLVKYLTANRYNVEAEVGYWRKANQIHRWLVENAQHGIDECQSVDVGRAQLEEARSLSKRYAGVVPKLEEALENAAA
jgi:hypothetical protein